MIKDKMSMTEEWARIDGYYTYQVSNFGRIKSTKFDKEHIMAQSTHQNGNSKSVELYERGRNKRLQVHHLVWNAFTFIKFDKLKHKLIHLDGNKDNNKINNLKLISKVRR